MAGTVMITGATTFLGKLVVRRLRKDKSVRTILSVGPKKVRGSKIVHVDAEPSDPNLAKKLRRKKVNALIHLDIVSARKRDDRVFEQNVLGSLQLVETAAELGVKKVVVRSSITVYGNRPTNPNYLGEDRRIRLRRAGSHYVQDIAQMERYLEEMLESMNGMKVTLLRFAPIVGKTCDFPLMRYLRTDVTPTLLGFDPLLQLLHEEDAADAVLHALESDFAGPVNVCPDGVAPLLRILRYLGREIVPVVHTAFLRDLPIDLNRLMYTLCGDNERMKKKFGFTPNRTTSEALNELKDELETQRR